MAAATGKRRPTLATVRKWPASVSVPQAALALGISQAAAYAAIARGTFPCKTSRIGNPGRIKVLTELLVAVLEGRAG